ncbi:hypothetical protein AMS68_002190 [Peltaster fructicola]|uniref:Uncharacterized protein n=1 Tax=Peltaster fructicola TaxID=286661 RepID=A0A6H0XPN7_9PEZI|nr:hypothetical protein AMS68_002190 [Peltaster fructicola]
MAGTLDKRQGCGYQGIDPYKYNPHVCLRWCEYITDESTKVATPKMVYYTQKVHHEGYDRISPLRPELSAKGKNVIVTGGGTGIGKAIATNFAIAGAKSVTILGRREDRLKSALTEINGAKTDAASVVQYRITDLMEREQVDAAVESVVKDLGSIDVLVTNAAALQELGPIVGYDAKEFMRGFDMNVLSTFNSVQSFLSSSGPQPIIINISTALSHTAPMPGAVGYAVSKAANLKMMDYFAAENPHLHIVNVQPGTVETEMSAKVGVKGPDDASLPGQFCVWLASPEARFLRSKFVWANWDADELLAKADEIKNSRLFTWLLDGVPM